MELKNGYKVIYDIASNNEHVFYASKSGLFDDQCEKICSLPGEKKYKLIYEKEGQFFISASGIPAETDECLSDFNRVFDEDYVAPKTKSTRRRSEPAVEPPVTETPVEEPVIEEPVVEEPAATPEVEE